MVPERSGAVFGAVLVTERVSGSGTSRAPGFRASANLPCSSVMFLLAAAAVFAACLAAGQAGAQTEFRGEIREGTLFKVPIEVREWDYVETPRRLLEEGESCEAVLIRNLGHSGFFEVRREQFFLAGARDSSRKVREVQAIVTGTVRTQRGKVKLEGRLVDAATGGLIFRQNYDLGDPPDRWVVHGFSDDVVLYLTGERGCAQTRIAFVGDATGHKEIYLVDYDGARVSRKTNLNSISVSPRWSPDGTRLAFTTYAHGTPELAGLDLAQGRIWSLSNRRGTNSAPCWHPDGRRIAASLTFEGNAEIYMMNADGADLVRLTWEPSIDTSPTFNPEGTRMAFTSDRTGIPQVHVMDLDGANLRRLTDVGSHSDSPDWSPKGDRIVFVSLIDRVFDICTIRPDGTDLRRLTGNSGSHENPRWAPNGRHIVYANRVDGQRKLFIMAADGTGIRQLTWSRGEQYNPAWSPPLGSASR